MGSSMIWGCGSPSLLPPMVVQSPPQSEAQLMKEWGALLGPGQLQATAITMWSFIVLSGPWVTGPQGTGIRAHKHSDTHPHPHPHLHPHPYTRTRTRTRRQFFANTPTQESEF